MKPQFSSEQLKGLTRMFWVIGPEDKLVLVDGLLFLKSGYACSVKFFLIDKEGEIQHYTVLYSPESDWVWEVIDLEGEVICSIEELEKHLTLQY